MDIIFLHGLKIDTIIGIYDWERKIRQEIILDIEMGTNITKAVATDHINDTLNYKIVAKRLIQFVKGSKFNLVETLAEECTKLIRTEFNIAWVKLTLNKRGAIRGAQGVGIILERGSRTI